MVGSYQEDGGIDEIPRCVAKKIGELIDSLELLAMSFNVHVFHTIISIIKLMLFTY